MPKYCQHCGESITDRAKFCSACGMSVNQATKFLSVNVDKDVNGTLNVAARDVIQANVGELVDCKYCNATGNMLEICSECNGGGYSEVNLTNRVAMNLASAFTLITKKRTIPIIPIIRRQEAKSFPTSYEKCQELFCYVMPCRKCGGKTSGYFVAKKSLPFASRDVTGFSLGEMKYVKFRIGLGKVPNIKEICTRCHGYGKMRL